MVDSTTALVQKWETSVGNLVQDQMSVPWTFLADSITINSLQLTYKNWHSQGK